MFTTMLHMESGIKTFFCAASICSSQDPCLQTVCLQCFKYNNVWLHCWIPPYFVRVLFVNCWFSLPKEYIYCWQHKKKIYVALIHAHHCCSYPNIHQSLNIWEEKKCVCTCQKICIITHIFTYVIELVKKESRWPKCMQDSAEKHISENYL